ncbi:MAG: hypothetical protein PHT94_03365 [Candidatus Nanoarchaeia archaeon]|nr:hypothetical protein [Candidatus Nanoarchaeia archaeon]
MEKKKPIQKVILLLVFILLITPMVLSSSLNIEKTEIDVFKDEKAVFNVTYQNTDSMEKSLGLILNSPSWNYYTEPYFLNVGKNEKINFLLYLEQKDQKVGLSRVSLRFTTQPNNEEYNSSLYIYTKDEVKMDYVTFLVLNSILNKEKFIPNDDVFLNIKLSKLNPKKLNNLTLKISSDIYNKQISFKMEDISEYSTNFQFKISEKQLPLNSKLTIEVIDGNKTEAKNTLDLIIPEYSPELDYVYDSDLGFLKKIEYYNVSFNGNINDTKEFDFKDNFFNKLFRSYVIDTKSEIKDNKLLINVEPFKEYSLEVKYNYVILLLLIIVLAISTGVYIFFKKPITIKKEVKKIYESSGIKNIRFLLYIKNNTGTKIHNLRIVENLPNLIEYIPSKEFGVLKPKYINEKENDFDMVWEFKIFEPYEERIITFDVVARFDIIGRLKIPSTKLKFLFLGLKREIQSNSIMIKIKNKGDGNNKE